MTTSTDDDYDPEVGTYKPGSVTNIKLKNFLTYEKVEFTPGPRLNMVIGANGTGKSTILCAICLGLGGEPKLLGRADDARAFIMHEKGKALIELTLAPQPGQPVHVLTRKIDREKGSERGNGKGASTFFINGKTAKIKEIHQLVKETYNITIDNLCTFLPQDKVGSFSGFDAQQLLTETEKTLSASSHLYNQHMDLIEAERELNSGDHNVDTIVAKLDKLKAEQSRYEREKARMEEREKALEEVALIKKKMIWLKFNKVQEETHELKAEKKVVVTEFKTAQKELQPLEEEHDALAVRGEEVKAKCKALDHKSNKYKRDIENQTAKYDVLDENLETFLTNLKEVDCEKSKKKAAYETAQVKVEAYQSKLDELPTQETINETYNTTSQEKKTVHRACMSARKECEDLQSQFKAMEGDAYKVESKLSKLLDEKEQQRRYFFKSNPNPQKAAQWIQKNRNNFRRPVWGPIACEVSMKSNNAAAFLEQHVANNTLKSFVVEDKADYDMLYNEVRKNMKIPINVILVRNGELQDTRRMYGDAKMETLKRDHGVLGYLDEMFTAPDAVMQALRSYASVHKVLVGSEATQTSMDERGLLEFLSAPDANMNQSGQQGSVIFTSKGQQSKKYQTDVSRYSKKIGTRIDDVFAARMLVSGGNTREKKDLQERLERIHQDISKLRPGIEDAEKTKVEIERQGQEIQGRFAGAKTRMESYRKLSSKVGTATVKLNDAKEDLEADDGAKKKKEIIVQIKMTINKISMALEMQGACHDKLMDATISSAGTKIARDAVASLLRKLSDELVDKQRLLKGLEERAIQAQKELNAKKVLLHDLRARCDVEAPLRDEDGNETELVQQLQEVQYDDYDEAEAALESAQDIVNSIHNDPNAVKQYNQVCKEVDTVQAQLEDMQGSKDSMEQKINNIKGPWKQALEISVTKINVLFVDYMNEVQCTGEVRLKMGGDAGKDDCDYKKWGIEIRVSFREGVKAQVLSAQVQSGGERAVSTIMYLMALQEMMVAPFRAVDEINQGLDERNERLVFRRIVQNSTKPPVSHPADHAGQYFLITPKLLPNMVDMESEAVTPLIVMNGPFNFEDPKDFDVDKVVAAISGSGRKRTPEGEENVENQMPSPTNGRSSRKKRKS